MELQPARLDRAGTCPLSSVLHTPVSARVHGRVLAANRVLTAIPLPLFPQCVKEGWSDKLKEQAHEGCNIAGRVRVNKVVGNIHLSPGRSFRTSAHNLYELVPYLKEDGNRHDFSHTIHEFAFEGDDEYDFSKASRSRELKARVGIDANPLDKTELRVSFLQAISAQARC